MKNLLFQASFDGADFHGWQQQNELRTVQGTIKDSVKALTGEDVVIYGCSRTDAGVHANKYYFNFKTESSIPTDNFVKALLTKLPSDLVVTDCKQVKIDFNSRFDCLKKEYTYIFYNDFVLSPFYNKRAYWYRYKMNEDIMNEAAKKFVGTYDFSSFCAAGAQVNSKVRTIYYASVNRDGNKVFFTVCGNGFLYNMVRIMAGTLISVNEGKISVDDIEKIILKKDRKNAGVTLPPDGLYLNNVFYGGDIFEEIEV